MSRKNELVKNTFIISLGQFLPQLFNIILVPVVTEYLTTEQDGIYDFILTLVSLMLPIATLQIQSAAFRFLIEERGNFENCKKIISNIFFFTLATSVVVVIAFCGIYNSLSIIGRILLGIYLYADITYILFGQVIRGLADNKSFSVGAIILSATKTLFVVLALVVFKLEIEGVLFALMMGYIIASLYLVFKGKLYRYISIKCVSKKQLVPLIQYSWPMIPNNLSSWALKISDRLVITFFLGYEANAVYAAANNIPNILNVARGVLIMAWQENASIAVNDSDASAYYSKLFKEMYAMIAGVTALVIGFSPLLFKLLVKGDYADAFYQMPLLFLGVFYGCMSAFQGGIYIAHKRTQNVGMTTLLAALINIIVDLSLVNVIGIYAGSISTLVSYLALFIYRLIDVKKFQEMEYSYKHIIGIAVVLVVMCILGGFKSIPLYIINCALGIIFAYSINKDMIHGLIPKVINLVKSIFINITN